MIEIVYETHALTTDNESGIATGWHPGDLSPAGREQALDLGRRRANDGIAAVFTSDLHRAVETAAIAFAGTPLPIHRDARLRECDYGALTGTPSAHLPRARHLDVPFPGGQSYRDVVTATADFLRDLSAWEGTRLLVIAHSANRWALDHLLTSADLKALVTAPFAWQPGWEYRL
ncbi:histidine phosphatase family protein [Herbidospora sp. RD11066]